MPVQGGMMIKHADKLEVGKNGRLFSWGTLRVVVLSVAFLLILINPLLNYYFHNDFIQGWYQSFGVGKLWFVSPLEGIESLLITKTLYMPALIGIFIPFVLAFLLGRVFCSWVCPINFLAELIDRVCWKIGKKKYLRNKLIVAKKLLWFTLIAELLASMILGAPLFVFLSPPGLVGREIMMVVYFGNMALEGIIILVVLALELVTRRFFCRTFCPLGAMLAMFGTARKLRVIRDEDSCTACGLCDMNCPMGIKPSLGEAEGPYCWNCGECIDNCHHESLSFTWIGKP